MNRESKDTFDDYTPEQLSELYKNDPGHFEELAEAALSRACVGRTPEQTIRFRQMQWTIDAQLRKGKTPPERMHIMESIFYGKVFGEDGELAHLMTNCMDLLRLARGTGEQAPQKKPSLRLVKG